ncbi:MAG: hypothetical protein ABJ308_15930 [Halieaceae bacterium]
MGIKYFSAALLLLLLVQGCRLVQTAPEGGSIVSASGSYDCAEGQTCIIDMTAGRSFGETFTATPRSGYVFDGWKQDAGHFCGGKLGTCDVVMLDSLTGYETDLFLEAQFSADPDAVSDVTRYIYIATSSSDSNYFRDLDISFDSSTQYIFRINIDTGEAVEVDSNYSPSYARSTIYSYTVDDRYYIREEYSTQHNFTEYDPATLAYRSQIGVFEPLDDRCSAIVGNTSYFYRIEVDYDPFFGNSGGEFMKLDLFSGSGSGAGTQLPQNECYYNLGSSNGVLYDAIYLHDWDGSTSAFGFYQRDQSSGVAVPIAEFTQPDGDDYTEYGYSFHYDGNSIFMVREKTTGEIEIVRYRQGIDSLPQILYVSGSDLPAGFNPFYRDANDGYVVISDGEGFMLVFNANNGSAEYLDLGTDIYDMQFLHISD